MPAERSSATSCCRAGAKSMTVGLSEREQRWQDKSSAAPQNRTGRANRVSRIVAVSSSICRDRLLILVDGDQLVELGLVADLHLDEPTFVVGILVQQLGVVFEVF